MKIGAKLRKYLHIYRSINFQNWILKTDMNHGKCQNMKQKQTQNKNKQTKISPSIFAIFVFSFYKNIFNNLNLH